MAKKFKSEFISLNDVYVLAEKLALKIKDAGFQPDLIIAIARGGYVPARLLCDFLNIRHMASIQVEHYSEGATMEKKAIVKYPLNIDVNNNKVLLVDDVNDTSESLLVSLDHIEQNNKVVLKTAVLHEKKISTYKADFVAEYHDEWRWLIYEWAVVEDIGSFVRKANVSSLNQAKLQLELDYDIHFTENRLKEILEFSNIDLK